ncbi:MAG: acyl-CoA transferase [Micavibrio aeruginosavorus]|uniref:Acyl-CoA transferase n=1 Tax=Micavibrio aeruginosavorus TaxID=349221 RepID=A0A7T5R3I2_9BACT|nr:MAG: acyl-CoA transferase [Micavibrio aeruginosavorus]
MQSQSEKILDKLKTLIDAATTAKIERNSAVPEKIPPTGLIIIRDGNPGDPEYVLGGFSNVYYSHNIEIEVYIQEGAPAQRDLKFDQLMQLIGTVLESHPTLDGLVAGLTYARPDTHTQPIDGGPAIKAGVILLMTEYETPTPLT